MIQSAPAVAIGTVPLIRDLTALFPNVQKYGEVKVINAAPNPMTVTVGADQHWLDSWSADVFCLRGVTQVTLTPTILGNPQTSVPNPSVLLSIAEASGEIPGVYPTTIDRTPTTQQTVASGNLLNMGDTVVIATGGATGIGVGFTGAVGLAAGSTLRFEVTVDNTLWSAVPIYNFQPGGLTTNWQIGQLAGALTLSQGINYFVPVSGAAQMRLRLSASGAGQGSIAVTLRATPGSVLAMPMGQQTSVESQPVVIASDQTALPITPSLVSRDTVLSASFSTTLASGGTLDLVAAVGGQTVYVLAWSGAFMTAAAGTVNLEDDNGVVLAIDGGAAIHGFTHVLYGAGGTVGHKVRLHNTSGAAAGAVLGELIYVQK